MSDHAHAGPDRPVQPEIPRSRFAFGMARDPLDMEDLRLGRFSDGEKTRTDSATGLPRGRFSEGQDLARTFRTIENFGSDSTAGTSGLKHVRS